MRLLGAEIAALTQEHLPVLAPDTKNSVVHMQTISLGNGVRMLPIKTDIRKAFWKEAKERVMIHFGRTDRLLPTKESLLPRPPWLGV
jgi:DNA repair protein RadC